MFAAAPEKCFFSFLTKFNNHTDRNPAEEPFIIPREGVVQSENRWSFQKKRF